MKTDNLARPIKLTEEKQSPQVALLAPPTTQVKQITPDNCFDLIDKSYQAQLGHITSGISPAAMMTVYCSWLAQLAQSPGRMIELVLYPVTHVQDYLTTILDKDHSENDADPRFKSEDWRHLP